MTMREIMKTDKTICNFQNYLTFKILVLNQQLRLCSFKWFSKKLVFAIKPGLTFFIQIQTITISKTFMFVGHII